MLWCNMGKHVLLNLEHSRQIHFHIRIDDLHMIPKRIAGMSRVIHNISSDVAAPLLGYNTVVLPKCIDWRDSASRQLCQAVVATSLPQCVTDASPHWPTSAPLYGGTASKKYTFRTSVESPSSCFVSSSTSF